MDSARAPEYYRPLAPGFIRVFELEAGNISDPIVGRLVPQAINDEPYEAVSYVWGDSLNRRDILVNGATLSVTANLHGALTAFRPQPTVCSGGPHTETGQEGRKARRLWIDAICINQEDLPERTAQVWLMGRIFAGASHVLAWLGWDDERGGRRHIQAAIKFIHAFMKDPEAGLQEARVLLHCREVTEPSECLVNLSDDDRRKLEKQAREWDSVKVLFEVDYFHRTWVVQELGLAREATLYTALKPADNGIHAPLELFSIPWPMVGRFVKILDGHGALLVVHLALQSWVAHHSWRVWETKEDGTPRCDFLTAMHWVRTHAVTDPRDRVYSLLGHPLAVLDGELVVKPDYTLTRGVTYTKLAANFIRKTKNLEIVNLTDHEYGPSVQARSWTSQDDGRMPSWVPDWHSINRTIPMHYPIDAAEVIDTNIRIEGDTDGLEGAPLPHLVVRGWKVDEIVAVSRRMETTDFLVTNSTLEQAKVNPFWLDRLWELLSVAQNNNALAKLEELSLALSFGTLERDQPGGKYGRQQTLEEHQQSFAAYVLEYNKLWHDVSKTKTLDGDNTLPARSLYDTLPVEAQAELQRRAQGTTSEGFLRFVTWSAMCRVVYMTTSGCLGMGSRTTLPGDLVCRVRGSPLLMTLRRIQDIEAGRKMETNTVTDNRPSCYAYIGPTVMPARQQWDARNGNKPNEQAVQFRIL